VVVSEATRNLCEGYFTLKAVGPTKVKGINEPVSVYEVTGLGPLRTRLQRSAHRGLTKFVGRHREMEAMRVAAEQAHAGHGQIVAAIAEAGAGKSRLFFEFKTVSRSGWLVLETFSVSHGKASAFLPIIELLHNYFQLGSDDNARVRREKIAGKVMMLDRGLEDSLPYLFGLLGIGEGGDPLAQMDGQVKKRRTLESIKRILLRESLNQPLMIIFEDLHWIDEETQAFLNLLADSIGTAKILLLVNYRPEYSHSWISKSYYTQLRLDPLGKESAEEMLAALLGDSLELERLKQVIIERTEGNPFFMEETVQVLLDQGALVRNGVVKLTKPIGELKIPPTVQAILAARIDRLPSGAKDLLQNLAVIGREFPLSLIRAVVRRPDDELNRMMSELQLGEFIYEQPAVGEFEYVFKHALTQEVAYGSVLVERRKQLHEKIGAALERQYEKSTDDHLDELAHHFGLSGNPEKALEYHERAGLRAAERSANQQAARYLNIALDLLGRQPGSPARDRRELGIQTALGPITMVVKGWAARETEQVYLRADELARQYGTVAQQFSALVGLFGIPFVAGRMHEAQERLRATQRFVELHPDPELMLEARHHEWSLGLTRGELEESSRSIDQGLAIFETLRSTRTPIYSAHHPAVCAHGWGGIAVWLRGFADEARTRADKSMSLARELDDPPSITYALGTRAQLHRLMREVQPALQAAEATITIAEQTGFLYFLSHARIVKGWALVHLDTSEEGLDEIREAIASLSASSSVMFLTAGFAALAEAYGIVGRFEEAVNTVTEGLELVRRGGECWWEADLNRLRGELLLMRSASSVADARSCFERAIQIARAQTAKSLELRATISLARILRDTNRRDEARATLAAIYNWFTEGFDTADLKEAKALLDELSR
jgi:predicted ATPase